MQKLTHLQENHKKLIISVLAGFSCLLFSGMGISVQMQDIQINLVWSVIFPFLISLAYGKRHGLLAGLAGGAWHPYFLWTDNGYANIASAIVLLILYYMIGYLKPTVAQGVYQRFIIRLSVIMGVFAVFSAVIYLFVFDILLSYNPSVKSSDFIVHLDISVLKSLWYKSIITYTFILLLAELLLRLPIIRKILSLNFDYKFRLNHRLFILSIATAFIVWIAFVSLDNILFDSQVVHGYKYYALILNILLASSVIVARSLIELLEKRLEIETKLNNVRKRQSTMIANIADVIAIIDSEGINLFKSSNVEKWFGWKPSELIGKSTWENVHPEDLKETKEFFYHILGNPKLSGVIECRWKRKDGEYKWIEVFAVNCLDKPEIAGILINYKDISERKKNLELQQEVIVARQSAEFKQKFLANMSHEIRTPLTGVLGMAEILTKTPLNSTQQDYLNTLIHSGENLKEIINLILDYSKIEAGKVALKQKVFSLQGLVSEVENFFLSVSQKDIIWHTTLDEAMPISIVSDKLRISQVIRNLVSNAVKFTEKGSISLRISTVNTITRNNQIKVLVEIEDTGTGIPSNIQKQLFEPFFQIDDNHTRNNDGTGLGLAICKELVNLLGGEIGFDSVEGKGSRFWFTFYCTPGAKNFQYSEEFNSIDKKSASKMLNILLVEDKQINKKVISLLLKTMGHEVNFAGNGKEAIDAFQPGIYDLILMDIQMPVMDGITATKKLRENYRNLPPIVGLSANAFEGDREKYMHQGLDEYLTKPVNLNEFLEVLAKLKLN